MRRVTCLIILVACCGFALFGCAQEADLANSVEAGQETETPQSSGSESETPQSSGSIETDMPLESDLKKTEQEIAQAVLDEYDFKEGVPTLSIMYDDKTVTAARGTYSWSIEYGIYGTGIESDSVAPEELIEYQEGTITIDEDTEILLVFSRPYISLKVEIWNEQDYDSAQEIDVYGDRVIIAKDQPRTIYAVTAKFEFVEEEIEESGTIHYAFVVN